MKINDKKKRKNSIYIKIKMILDVCIALIGIIISMPIMVLIAIAIKIDSKGPILFKQERNGKNGKKFYVYKFRSMIMENDVHDFTCKDKYTRVGKIIRKLSLDELPQLFNILKLEMSFIGPRPWIVDYYEHMTQEQRGRYDVLPGLTGLAQVNGRNDLSIFDKINYDLEYRDNISLMLDIKIVLLTIKVVLSKKGVNAGKGVIHKELKDLREQNKTLLEV